jgi:hypothetical protein
LVKTQRIITLTVLVFIVLPMWGCGNKEGRRLITEYMDKVAAINRECDGPSYWKCKDQLDALHVEYSTKLKKAKVSEKAIFLAKAYIFSVVFSNRPENTQNRPDLKEEYEKNEATYYLRAIKEAGK